jgi:lincosamide nucleotidyltransferase B/F
LHNFIRGVTLWLLRHCYSSDSLTNLYVGLCRYNRGEKLSALNFIQVNSVERVLELIPLLETPTEVQEDIFSLQRRFEFRYPTSSLMLSKMLTGYDHIPKSAEAILEFLDSNFSVNVEMKNRILELCRGK